MLIAKVFVTGVSAHARIMSAIPKGIVGATVEFDFSDAWDGLSKTVVFWGCERKDVLNAGASVEVPKEVVEEAGGRLRVGVYGTAYDGDSAIPTLWCDLGKIQDAADPSGDSTTNPSLPVWAQILKDIGDLSELQTEAKDNLVNAINESYAHNEENGADGKDCKDGKDGVSCTHVWNGTVLTVTSASGTTSADLKGEPGKDGSNGEKGDAGLGVYYSTEIFSTKPSPNGTRKLQFANIDTAGRELQNGDFIITSGAFLFQITNATVSNGYVYGEFLIGLTGIKGDDGKNGLDGYTPQKNVDYFDGKDGTSVTVASVSESTADGGSNEVKFSDGKTLTVKNGKTGRRGNGFLLYNGMASDGYAYISDLIVPGGYTPALGDLILCADGTVVRIADLVDEGAMDGAPTGIIYADFEQTGIVLKGSAGKDGADGKDGKDGKNGADGYTPVRGTDYWTEADQEAIVQQVIAALGTPVFGRVDADNNIILTGELADGTYTLKYEDAEGNLTVIGTFDTSPGYTNMIPLSVEADDTPYNGGQGWKADTRLSSSGGESTSSATGMEVIGFVPFKRGDIIRFRDITMNPDSSNAARCYFIQYDENKTMLKQWIVSGFNDAIKSGKVLVDESGNILQINTGDFDDESTGNSFPIYTNAAYFRISADEINEHSIITINEEIPADEETYTNWLPISTDTDGRIYNGVGYKANVRLSASSGYTETAMDIGDPLYLTGYIPVKTGDVLRFYNMTISAAADENYTGRLYVYDTSKTGVETNSAIHYASVNGWNVVSENSNVTQLTYGGADGFIRINADNITAESIITINQEIA